MSDDERFQIIGRVVSEHEEARRTLAALLAKASTLSNMLRGVADLVAEKGVGRFYTDGSQFQLKDRNGLVANYQGNEWPTMADVQQLLTEIASTREQIADLERRRKELGIST